MNFHFTLFRYCFQIWREKGFSPIVNWNLEGKKIDVPLHQMQRDKLFSFCAYLYCWKVCKKVTPGIIKSFEAKKKVSEKNFPNFYFDYVYPSLHLPTQS